MGACEFMTKGVGKTAKEAFAAARERALYDHGHAGYSGTLAEKRAFTEIAVPAGVEPSKFAQDLISDGDPRIDDKWGPAGCVKLADGEWLFFGWASS